MLLPFEIRYVCDPLVHYNERVQLWITLQNLHACQVLTSCAISAQLIRLLGIRLFTFHYFKVQ